MSSEKLWSDVLMRHPVTGKLFRTKYKGETSEAGKVTVLMEMEPACDPTCTNRDSETCFFDCVFCPQIGDGLNPLVKKENGSTKTK